MLSLIKNKVQIQLSFFVCVIIMIALKLTEQFFIIFLVVSIHELSHAFVAKRFGLIIEKIIITPIGQVAVILDLKTVGYLKEILILFAGPAVNFCIAGIMFLVIHRPTFFIVTNILIGIFNLLPIYPLDGGRILYSVLENTIGTFQANKIIIFLARLFSKVLIILGFIQVIIYPFNMSLLLIGVYIGKTIEKERIFLMLNYYRKLIKRLNN